MDSQIDAANGTAVNGTAQGVAPQDGNILAQGNVQPHQPHHTGLDPTKYKTKLCRNFSQRNQCHFGDSCSFAHGQHDLQQPPTSIAQPMFKTKLCRHFQTTGACPYADKCGFAHGEAELNTAVASRIGGGHGGMFHGGHGMPGHIRMPVGHGFGFPMSYEALYSGGPKRAPPQELIKTRLCRHYASNGACPYGDRCLFAHGQNDLRAPRAMMVPSVQHMVPVAPTAQGGAVPHGHWTPSTQWGSYPAYS